MPDNAENPYQAPHSQAPLRRSLGALTILLITLAAVVAGVCTFFCTCFGVVAIGAPGFTTFSFAAVLFWVVVAFVAALFAARGVNRGLRGALQKKLDNENDQRRVSESSSAE